MKNLLLFFVTCIITLKLNAQSVDKPTNDIASGYIIGSTATSVAFMTNKKYPILYGFGSTVIFGVGKELFDKYYKRESFDHKDIFATLVGGVAGTITVGIVIDKKLSPTYKFEVW